MPSPLSMKLLLRPGYRVTIVNAPPDYLDLLQPLPDSVQLLDATTGDLDFVQLFVRNTSDLDEFGPATFKLVKPGGLLWVCYPKGGTRAGTDLNRDILWSRMSEFGLAGIAMVAIDDTWSAMRFRAASEVGT